MVVLSGNKVYLKSITDDDTVNIIRWRNSESVRKNFIFRKPFTDESQTKWLETVIRTGEAVQFIIYDINDKKPIGSSYLRDVDKEHKKAEYGIFIGEESARGKGLGTETAQLMIKYAFEELSLHKIYLRVFSDNITARKSYEKAGFIEEAYLKDEIFIDGTYRDIVLMAKISSVNEVNGDGQNAQ